TAARQRQCPPGAVRRTTGNPSLTPPCFSSMLLFGLSGLLRETQMSGGPSDHDGPPVVNLFSRSPPRAPVAGGSRGYEGSPSTTSWRRRSSSSASSGERPMQTAPIFPYRARAPSRWSVIPGPVGTSHPGHASRRGRDRRPVRPPGGEATAQVDLPVGASEDLVVRRQDLDPASRRDPELDARRHHLRMAHQLLDDRTLGCDLGAERGPR